MRIGKLLAVAVPTFPLLVAGRWLGTPDFDTAFAFDVPLPAGLAAAAAALVALLVLATRPGWAEGAGRGLTAAFGRIPPPLRVALLVAVATGLFLLLPAGRLSGDGAAVVFRAAVGRVYPSNALTDFLTMGLIRGSGLDPARAVALLSVLSGAAFAWFAVLIARECRSDPAGRAGVTALLLASGTALLFFGRIEVYAPPAAAMAAYLWLALARVNGRGRGIAAPLVLGVAFSLHGASGLLLPTLLLLEPGARVRLPRALARGALFLAPVAATVLALFLLAWGGAVPPPGPDRTGTFLGAMGQGPVLPLVRTLSNLTHRYAILDAEHLLGVANLLLLAAPAGLPLLLLRRRGFLADPRARLAAVAAVPFVAFALLWNVSFPLRHDWDLFAAAGIPLTLLGAFAAFREEEGAGTLLAAGLLSLLALAPRVAAECGTEAENRRFAARIASVLGSLPAEAGHGPAAEAWERRAGGLDSRGAEALFGRANDAADAGRFDEAAHLYREVLAREPDHAPAALNLGRVLLELGRRDEAGRAFLRAIEENPMHLEPRLRLARAVAAEGETEEAIRILTRGIRSAPSLLRAVDALSLLADLLDSRGRQTDAARVRRLLGERRRLLDSRPPLPARGAATSAGRPPAGEAPARGE